jgi:hypothetical protein
MKEAQNWKPDVMYVEPLQVRSFNGEIRQYAKNSKGLHVPTECMGPEDLKAAIEAHRGQ